MIRMRRKVVLIAVLLIAGAIVNVAVAWGISQMAGPIVFSQVRVPRFGKFHWDATNTWWRVTYLDEAGMAYLSTWRQPAGFVPDPKEVMSAEDLPRWSRLRQSRADASGVFLPHWREYARGWPMHAMFFRMEEDTSIYKHVSFHTVDAPFRTSRPGTFQRQPEEVLPLGIIWPGFLINTLFYAAILWALFFTPGLVRRSLRRRRGQCAACGYPIGVSSTCSECGAAVTPRVVEG